MTSVFIDGAAGTTGLEIRERLAGRKDLSLVVLSDTERKDPAARKKALNQADLVILCLPDDAAKEAVSMIDNPNVRVIDASTAYRVAPDWAFGFPEMSPEQRDVIRHSKRVSNPGCYPTGFIALVRPLVKAGLIPPDFPLTVNALSGYSGGGKALIEEMEGKPLPDGSKDAFRGYGLPLAHKHVPEMQIHSGLNHPPVFAPAVARYYRGMIVEVPLQLWALPGKPKVSELHKVLTEAYAGETFVEVVSEAEAAELQKLRGPAGGYVAALDPEALKDTNRMRIFVFGNDKAQQAMLVASFDNLGKGASGAAVQNLNLMLGLPETTGLK